MNVLIAIWNWFFPPIAEKGTVIVVDINQVRQVVLGSIQAKLAGMPQPPAAADVKKILDATIGSLQFLVMLAPAATELRTILAELSNYDSELVSKLWPLLKE